MGVAAAALINAFALSNVILALCSGPWDRVADYDIAIIHLDPRLQVPVALPCRHLRYSCYPHDCGASAQVSDQIQHPYPKLAISLGAPFLLPRNEANVTDPFHSKDKIQWECNNGGQLWTSSSEDSTTTGNLPAGFCISGFSSLNYAFIISLIVDLVCQLYMLFLNWRFSKRLEHYREMSGPYQGGKSLFTP
jgi:hypothetical protein